MKYLQLKDGLFYADLTGSAPPEWLMSVSDIDVIEAPDYVFTGWGYDPTKEGDERFIKPVPPEGWLYDDSNGTFYTFKSLKESKRSEIDSACKKTITDGVDVELPSGTEHFSLKETDQINLMGALTMIDRGATSYPYHTDGTLCRVFTADELKAISAAAMSHKLYHTTYCNHVFNWIERCETKEELESIYYGATLPDDLLTNMNEVLASAQTV